MLLKDEATASQEIIWDFDIDAVAGLTSFTSLTTIAAPGIAGSRGRSPRGVISSAPSGLSTPTIGRNPGKDSDGLGRREECI